MKNTHSNTNTQPSPAAMRAAEALVESALVIVRDKSDAEEIKFIAEVIDQQMGVKILEDSLKLSIEEFTKAIRYVAQQALYNAERKASNES